MPIHISQYRSRHAGATVIAACLIAASGSAQTAREVRGAAAVEPLQNEPPAKIIIDPPVAEALSRGVHESFTRQAAAFLASDSPFAPY